MAKIKANEALVKALQAWEIDHLYGIQGESIDAVVDKIRAEKDSIELFHVRHEEVETLASVSNTKLTVNIEFAVSICGPVIVHLLNDMYEAKKDHVPQLILAAKKDTTALGT